MKSAITYVQYTYYDYGGKSHFEYKLLVDVMPIAKGYVFRRTVSQKSEYGV